MKDTLTWYESFKLKSFTEVLITRNDSTMYRDKMNLDTYPTPRQLLEYEHSEFAIVAVVNPVSKSEVLIVTKVTFHHCQQGCVGNRLKELSVQMCDKHLDARACVWRLGKTSTLLIKKLNIKDIAQCGKEYLTLWITLDVKAMMLCSVFPRC